MSDETKNIYLNRDGRWADFEWRGLKLEGGALRLHSLPLLAEGGADELAELPAPVAPAGVAVGDDGTVYFTDPQRHRVLTINTCDGAVADAPCLGGEGQLPTRFSAPRGLLFLRARRALFVADSGNHRVQIFDAQTLQLVGVWGSKDQASAPQPGDEPGSFDTPQSLAADREGNVYVADAGNSRVQKFDALGHVVESFAEASLAAMEGAAPTEVAITEHDGTDRLCVLAPGAARLYVLDTQGQLVFRVEQEFLRDAMGLAAGGGAIYVGDNRQRRVIKFGQHGVLVGEARGYRGPVAALALTEGGQLLVHTGGVEAGIIRLSVVGAFARRGFMWGGPFGTGSALRKEWHRLRVTPGALPRDAHLNLFVFATDDINEVPAVDEEDAQSARPFASAGWAALPPGATDGLIRADKKSYLWIGAELQGEGTSTPALKQMRLSYNHEGYLKYFPAIYREDERARAFGQDFLALYESLFGDVEEVISTLGSVFDAGSAPEEFLGWLAGWLALDLDERWTEQRRRRAIARAFELYARRGTAEGLREALRFFAGIEARVEEPILHASWWSLAAEGEAQQPGGALLGFGTTLAPEEAQGAVVGTSATYDESSLITADEFGSTLFSPVAHRFVVQIYQGQSGGEGQRRRLEDIIEREKPAHTAFHLCVVEPEMRVGFQARLGVDSVVGGPAEPAGLDRGASLVLGGEPSGRVGGGSRLGLTTRLGDAGPDGS